MEITLESLHLVVSPKERSEWSHINFNSYERKIEILQEFAEEIQEKLKNAGKEEDEGYLDKLGSKIVDNI